MARGWGVSRRRPELVRWSGAECAECGLPVEVVVLDADPLVDPGTRVAVERVVITTKPQPDMIAARVISGTMHGYVITKLRPLAAGYSVFRRHLDFCEFAPPPPHEQQSLFGTDEGNTTP